jgi:hypothetical protein
LMVITTEMRLKLLSSRIFTQGLDTIHTVHFQVEQDQPRQHFPPRISARPASPLKANSIRKSRPVLDSTSFVNRTSS